VAVDGASTIIATISPLRFLGLVILFHSRIFLLILRAKIGKKAKIKQENEKKESRKQKNRLKTDEKMA
jgi:hypothetical protein